MKHKAKIKVAKILNGKITGEGKVILPFSGWFGTKKWQERKDAIAKGVQNKITKIKAIIKLKKEKKMESKNVGK